jgi:hypothetical protein
MTWVKLDDGFADHPKVIDAGPLASWLFVCGLAYCSRQLTDGFIPTGQVRRLADVERPDELVNTLIRVGMWQKVDGGYQVHDYLDYQPSADEVKRKRGEAADRMRKLRSQEVRANISGTSQEVRQPRPVPVPSRTPTHNPTVEENVSLSDAPTTETPKPKVITEAERTFGEFWALYPKGRGSKKLAAEEWKKLKAADWHEILAKLPIFTDCYDWQKEGGKYVKHAERWIKNRGWEDDVPTYVAPRPVNTKNNNPNAALALAAELRRTEQ